MAEQGLVGLASVVVLGVAGQWVAARLRMPAILMLLVIGISAGAGTELAFGHRWLSPDRLFGDLFYPIVSLSVAIILFEGGLTLHFSDIKETGGVVRRLVSIGALVTWAMTTLLARWILGLEWPMSVLVGAVLIVTGPTVIQPLLRHVRPVGRSAAVLKWEGIVIDPVGATLALLVFEAIQVSTAHGQLNLQAMIGVGATVIGWTILFGGLVGVAGAALLVVVLKRFLAPDHLQNPVALAVVIGVFTVSNLLQGESGLLAVTVMGVALANQKRVSVGSILEFKEALVVLLVASLFILLGSRLKLQQLTMLGWPTLIFLFGMIGLVRPLSVAVSTLGSSLNWRERVFIAWMAPRGIVAAAVASVFAIRLLEKSHGDNPSISAEQAIRLVPITFAVIIATVTVYGLTARRVAKALGLTRAGSGGFLIAGANPLARTLAEAVQKSGQRVLLVDTNTVNVSTGRLAGLETQTASILSEFIEEHLDLGGIGQLLAITPNDEVNSLATMRFGRVLGRSNVYQLAPETAPGPGAGGRREKVMSELRGRMLFSRDLTYRVLSTHLAEGMVVKSTLLSKDFSYAAYLQQYQPGPHVPLFVVDTDGDVKPVTADGKISPRSGQIVIALVPQTRHPIPTTPTPTATEAAAEAVR